MPLPLPLSLHVSPGLRRNWVVCMLGFLPLIASAVLGSVRRDTPPLDRSGTPKRTLQFAYYCYNHGRDPIQHTSTLTSRFRFRNVGTETIQLGHIERSCGCLTPEISCTELKSGEMGELKVTVPLEAQNAGFHEFQLTVNYRDPGPRQETLLIKAFFPEPQIHVSPRAMDISCTVLTDRPVTHQFTINDHRSRPLQVRSVESSSPWISGSIRSVENEGRLTRIGVRIDSRIPAGRHRALISALTDDPEFPSAVMPIRITGPERPEPVRVIPSRLHMRAGDSEGRPMEMHIPADWEISHVDCFPSEMLCKWTSTRPDPSAKHQRVYLVLSLSTPLVSRTREGVVTLHANGSREMVTASVAILPDRKQSTATQYSTN